MSIRKKASEDKELLKKSPGFVIFFTIMFILLLIHAILLIYPFIWLLINSLKDNYDFITTSSLTLPEVWKIGNYKDIFTMFQVKDITFPQMLFNSLWYSVGTAGISVAMGCVVSYTMAKYEFKAKPIIYAIIMFIMMFPIYGSGAAAYKQLFTLGLYDSPLILIKSAGGYGGFQFLMLYAFFVGLPREYMEAAAMDGAGHFTTFLRVMMPLAKGPISALFVVAFVNGWNDYMTPIISLPSYPGLSTGLYLYEQVMKMGMNYPIYYAACIITIVPVIAIFTCFQDAFLSNMSMGGIKG